MRNPDESEQAAALVFEGILQSESTVTRVWEIGCGVGSILLYLGERYPHVSFIGTDLNHDHVGRLNQAFCARGLSNVTVVEAYEFMADFACGITMICSRGTLYYIPQGPFVDLLEKIRTVDPNILVLCEPSVTAGWAAWTHYVSNKLSYAYDFGDLFSDCGLQLTYMNLSARRPSIPAFSSADHLMSGNRSLLWGPSRS